MDRYDIVMDTVFQYEPLKQYSWCMHKVCK